MKGKGRTNKRYIVADSMATVESLSAIEKCAVYSSSISEGVDLECEACGALGEAPLWMVGVLDKLPCPECRFVALKILTQYEVAQYREYAASLEDRFFNPPDTPLDEWLAGVDALLREMETDH